MAFDSRGSERACLVNEGHSLLNVGCTECNVQEYGGVYHARSTLVFVGCLARLERPLAFVAAYGVSFGGLCGTSGEVTKRVLQ